MAVQRTIPRSPGPIWSTRRGDDALLSDELDFENAGIGRVRSTLEGYLNLMNERPEFPGLALPKSANELLLVGDLHGDCISLASVLDAFPPGEARKIVFLGDFVDRAPKECPAGGFLTFLSLAKLKQDMPDDVFLLRGNHESFVLKDFAPHDIPMDLYRKFPDDVEELDQTLLDCFEALPLFVITDTGLYLTHGGLPGEIRSREELLSEDSWNKERMVSAVWGDPAPAKTYRGPVSNTTRFTEDDFKTFMTAVGSNVLVRGHDYHTLGHTLFGKRLITIFTSRRYAQRGLGGVLVIRTSLDTMVESTDDLEVLELKGEEWVGYEPGGFAGRK